MLIGYLRTAPASLTAALAIALSVPACAGGSDGDASGDTAGVPLVVDSTGGIPDAELERAARDVIAFLRGEVPFEEIELADSVALYVSPEGGGTRTVIDREQLRQPSSWVVSSGVRSHSLAPPADLPSMTVRVGRHFNCMEYPMSSRFEELAPLPHVGVKLERESGGNCLQTWNLTLVFDAAARPPRLVAAVYDQWEW